MDRLLSILLASAALLSPNIANAQDTALYTVAGDVPRAGTVPFEVASVVHVVDLLQNAGLQHLEGNALVLRGNPLKDVFSDNVRPQMPGRGSRLIPGDIVIFRALAPANATTGNAVLIADGAPNVFQLDSNDSILLRDVTSSFPEHLYDVSVTQTDFGSARTVVKAPTDQLAHGDVIQIRSRSVTSGPQISAISHSSQIADNHDHSSGMNGSVPDVTDRGQGLLTIPSPSNDLAGELPYQQATDSESESAGQMVLLPQAMSGTDSADTDNFRQVSFGTAATEDAFEVFNTADTATSEITQKNEASTSTWNALFMLGLVFAMGLIAVGWVKTQNERKAEQQTTEQQRSDRKTSASSDGLLLSDRKSVPIPPPEVRHSAVVSNRAEERVLDSENEAMNTDENCPVLSAGSYEVGYETVQSPEPVIPGSQSNINTGVYISNLERSAPTLVDDSVPLVNEHEWFGADWWKSETATIPDAVATETIMETPASDAGTMDSAELEIGQGQLEPDPSSLQTESEVHQDNSWGDLDDLINNRLPLELQQAQLPLRISLFGKPAGPQRLRIDAAHTQIAPPHMSLGVRNSRRTQPVAAASVNVTVPQNVKSRSDSVARTPKSSEVLPQDSNRFDRALNFLEEQADA